VRADQLGESSARAKIRPTAVAIARAAAVVVLAASVGLLLPGVAHGAGNPDLDNMIIPNPEPGWTSLSSQELSQLSQEIQTELTSKAPSNETYATAVEGWQAPQGSSHALLAIFLVEAIGGNVDMTASSVASNFCDGATNITPGSAPPIENVPSSAIATCSGNGLKTTIGAAIKGGILTMVASAGSNPLGIKGVGSVVMSQLDVIPGSSTPAGSGSSDDAIIESAIGAVVVVGALIALLLIRRRGPGTFSPIADVAVPPGPPDDGTPQASIASRQLLE